MPNKLDYAKKIALGIDTHPLSSADIEMKNQFMNAFTFFVSPDDCIDNKSKFLIKKLIHELKLPEEKYEEMLYLSSDLERDEFENIFEEIIEYFREKEEKFILISEFIRFLKDYKGNAEDKENLHEMFGVFLNRLVVKLDEINLVRLIFDNKENDDNNFLVSWLSISSPINNYENILRNFGFDFNALESILKLKTTKLTSGSGFLGYGITHI
jgi:hypothetical protein